MGQNQIIHCINYFGDKCACGWYRLGFPSNTLQTMIGSEYRFQCTDTESVITDVNFYLSQGGVRLVRIQRWYGPDKLKILKEFLKPLSEKLGFIIAYEIDDVLLYDDIPLYNIAKPSFHPDRVGNTITEIMELCDIITVSTEELKNFYIKRLNLPKEKFIVIPNYLPRWWIGDSYNLDRQMNQWKQQRERPRIAFACSVNHFDVQNKNNGIDDFSHLIPWIIHNINRYQFIFVGGVPLQLHKYIPTKQIIYQPPSDIFNYPREMQLRNIDLLVAPLQDNEFNRCKSNIKFLEFSALGIPMAGQNICTYNKYTKLVFNNGLDLDNIIEKLFFKNNSEEYYRNIILQQRQVIDGSPSTNNNGYWLEKNIVTYYNLYSISPKTIELTL